MERQNEDNVVGTGFFSLPKVLDILCQQIKDFLLIIHCFQMI